MVGLGIQRASQMGDSAESWGSTQKGSEWQPEVVGQPQQLTWCGCILQVSDFIQLSQQQTDYPHFTDEHTGAHRER